MTQGHKMDRYCWKNGAESLARSRVAADLQFVKKIVMSVKCSKAKDNTMSVIRLFIVPG